MNCLRFSKPALLLCSLLVGFLFSMAQEVTVSGKVVDQQTARPLAGVSVKVKNGTEGTVTNDNGEFSIKVPSKESILSFTFVGYGVFETKAGTGTLPPVQLSTITAQMEDVVVVGYTSQKRIHNTGAVDQIKSTEIEDLPVGNLGAALAGRVLGLSVSGGTSRPGIGASLTIRNPMSLSKDGGNNLPLFVIDDVIQVTAQGASDMSLFNSLDPSEIESISILKDASAAVYGSRGANGVVIVKTKRGVAGKPRISYSGSYAINDEVYRPKMMSAYELGLYTNIVNGPNGRNNTAPEYNFSQDELDHFKNINHDWLDQAWKSSYNMRHTLNVSGGADKSTYFANMSYYTQDGNLGRLEFGKWTFRAGADMAVASGFKVGVQVAGNQQNSTRVNSEIGGENVENEYRNLLRAPRYVPPYIDGLPVRLPNTSTSTNHLSAYHFWELDKLNNYINDDQTTLSVNLYGEYEAPFLKGLKLRGSYGRNASSSRDDRIGTRYTLYRFTLQGANSHIYEGATNPVGATASNDNRVRFSNTRSKLYQANFSLSYNKTFGLHSVSVFGSVEKGETESSQEDLFREDPSQFTNGQLNTAFGAIDGRTFAYESGTLGYIGRLSYNYDSKYIADVLFRTDASTKFAPENYWGKFYTLGVGWVISKEKFFEVNGIDFLKLRYNVGLLGKDDTRLWQWRQRYTYQNGQGAVFGTDNIPAGVGMKMEVSPNRDAIWSDDFKQNLGLDARFLKNRLSTTVELFYNKGTGMFIERTDNVPVTVGGSIASQNWGKIDFFGYELALGWNSTIGKDFNYGLESRFTWYDNKVHRGNFNDFDLQFPWNARPGQSSDNGKWGYDYLGMFRSQAEIDAYVTKNNITSVFGTVAANLRPGMLYYRDVRGALQADGSFAGPDGIININDQVLLSKKASNHYGVGLTLRAGWKGLSFDCVIAGSFGGWSEFDGRSRLESDIRNLYQNGPAYWADVYDPVLNPNGTLPNPWWTDISTSPVSDFWQVSALRMRMRNATLSYSLPKRVTNFLRINNARAVLSALNPLNLYNPFDYRDSDASWDVYPALRTISLGVNVSL